MCAQIIANVMKASILGLKHNMFGEYRSECAGTMVFGASAEYISVLGAKKSYQIGGTVAAVVELSAQGMARNCGKIRRQPSDCLNPCTLVKTKQILRWVEVQIDDRFHFRKEIWIGNLQEVAHPMRMQGMSCENTAESCATYITSYDIGVGIKIVFCIAERPPLASWQWRMLAEKGDGFQLNPISIESGTTTPGAIGNRFSRIHTCQPSGNRTKMTVTEPGDAG